MTRYVVMIKKPNGMMKIIGNKATKAEAETCAGTDGIIKTINPKKKKSSSKKAKKSTKCSAKKSAVKTKKAKPAKTTKRATPKKTTSKKWAHSWSF